MKYRWRLYGNHTEINESRIGLASHFGGRAVAELRAGRPNNAMELARVATHHFMEAVGRAHFVNSPASAGRYDELRYKPRRDKEDGHIPPVPPGQCACAFYA